MTFGGFSLQDHGHKGDALEAIDSRRWDVVAMQEGPSSLDESRSELIDWTGRFAARMRAAGGRPALYQLWPMDYRLDVFDRVLESYRLAAEGVQGELLPAGAAWAAAWESDPGLPLYGPDGFHPSAMGSYLAALAIYGELLDVSTMGLPSRLSASGGGSLPVDIPSAQAAILQAAADKVTGAP